MKTEGKWHIGRYATYVFYVSIVTVLALGFVLGLLFHPIIYR